MGRLLGDVAGAAGVGETTDDGLLVTGLQAALDTMTAAAAKTNLSVLVTD